MKERGDMLQTFIRVGKQGLNSGGGEVYRNRGGEGWGGGDYKSDF